MSAAQPFPAGGAALAVPAGTAGAAAPEWAVRRRRPWAAGRWGALVCRAAWDEAGDARAFLLAPADGSRIEHDPGQFLTVRVETPQGTVERCYTIASSAARDGGVEIVVKRKGNGLASAALHDALGPGVVIEASGPSGRFGPAAHPAAAYALLAAGSGVTPMLSILRTAADRGIDLDARLVLAAPRAEDAIGGAELAHLARRLPRLAFDLVPSRSPGRRLDAARLARLVPDMAARMVLCCGPEGFMAMAREAARAMGVPEGRHAEESFDLAAPEEGAPAAEGAALRRITFARSGASFDCAEGVSILRAAREAGVAMPSSCARGQCGTCKSFKHSGEVAMAHDGGIRQREIDRGFVLPCVARPLTDVVLDR